MNRRGFLAALAGLPFVGKLFPKVPNTIVRPEGPVYFRSGFTYGGPVGDMPFSERPIPFDFTCVACGDAFTRFAPPKLVEQMRESMTRCPECAVAVLNTTKTDRKITQKDKDAALCQMGIHEWRSNSEVYRRHLGFAEVDSIRCSRCKVSVEIAPFHREERPGWWIEGERDGTLKAVAGPVYPLED